MGSRMVGATMPRLLERFHHPWLPGACRYLYQNSSPAVQDYLATKLHSLGEPAIDKYLLQFVYLAVSRPNHALERTMIELCSKSFRISIKVRSHE